MKKILFLISEYLIKHRYCQNIGKFNVGDKVKYNWRAKSTLNIEKDINTVFVVKSYYENGEGIETECGQSISATWLKKYRKYPVFIHIIFWFLIFVASANLGKIIMFLGILPFLEKFFGLFFF